VVPVPDEKTAVQRYRKTAPIEAWQWRPGDLLAAGEMVGLLLASGADFHHPSGMGDTTTLAIHTLEGEMLAQPGDWIARGLRGEFWVIRADIFAATYEPACGPGESPTWAEDLADASLSVMRAKYPDEPAEVEPGPLNPGPRAYAEWRSDLGNRIEQLIGWAKDGQRPEYPAKPRLYILDAGKTDQLVTDILCAADRLAGEKARETNDA
jgi:hypothetical protein